MGASAGATANATEGGGTDATAFFADALFRPSDPARLEVPGAEGDAAAAAQASPILVASAAAGADDTSGNSWRHAQAFPRQMRQQGSMRS